MNYITNIGFADAVTFKRLTSAAEKVAVMGSCNRRLAIATTLSGVIRSAKFSLEVYPPVNGMFTPSLITVVSANGAKLMVEWTSSPHEEATTCAAA